MLTQNVVNLGPVERIAKGHGHCFVVEGRKIAVLRGRDNRLWAIDHKCPHQNGPLADGMLGNKEVVCPLHGHRFDLETGRGSEPGEKVKVFPVELRDGNMYLILED